MQVPVAVLVDRGPVAVRPDAREAAPVRLEVALGVAPDAARHPGPRPPADELADLAAHRLPVGVEHVHVQRRAPGSPSEHSLIGSMIETERKQAPTSVPPREVDDRRRARRRRARAASGTGAGFHGSPVVAIAVSDDRSASRVALRDQRAHERGRDAEQVHALRLDEPPEPVGRASRARPRRRRRVAPTAPPPTTVHGPMIQPMSVDEVDPLARVHVRLVGDLARDRDEEAAVDVDGALRPAGRARRVREQVGRLRVDLDRRQVAAGARGQLVPVAVAAEHHRRVLEPEPPPDDRVRRPSARRASASSSDLLHRARRWPRRSEPSAVITAFALASASRAAIAGAAKPEKIGTWTAPRCAHACEATATCRRHRQEDPDRVALADAERGEPLGEPRRSRRRARASSSSVRVAVLAEEDRRRLVRPRAAQPSGARRRPARLSRAPTNQRAHSIPSETSSTRSHGVENSSPRSSTTRRPEALRLVDREAVQLGVALAARARRIRRVTFARSIRSGGGRQTTGVTTPTVLDGRRPAGSLAVRPSRLSAGKPLRETTSAHEREPQVVDARRRLVRPVHDHARQHGRERRAAGDPARPRTSASRSCSGS